MNIQPVGERVLLKPIKAVEKTSGGIYIPEDAQEKKKEGIVVAVGKVQDIQPGDKVLYGGYSNEEFQIENETYLIVEAKDILAKLGGQ